jgi:hypothetical protein
MTKQQQLAYARAALLVETASMGTDQVVRQMLNAAMPRSRGQWALASATLVAGGILLDYLVEPLTTANEVLAVLGGVLGTAFLGGVVSVAMREDGRAAVSVVWSRAFSKAGMVIKCPTLKCKGELDEHGHCLQCGFPVIYVPADE